MRRKRKMPHKCNYCKQLKSCREKKLYSDGAGVGYPCILYAKEWICKDCDEYFLHKYKEDIKQSKTNEDKRLKEFIKKRNEYLKKKSLKLNAEVVKGGDE